MTKVLEVPKTFKVTELGIGRESITQGEIYIPSGDTIFQSDNRFMFYYQNTPAINKLIRSFTINSLVLSKNRDDGTISSLPPG